MKGIGHYDVVIAHLVNNNYYCLTKTLIKILSEKYFNSTYISLFPLEFEHLCDRNVCKLLNHLLNLVLSHLNLFL
jgi:hypothetical protein